MEKRGPIPEGTTRKGSEHFHRISEAIGGSATGLLLGVLALLPEQKDETRHDEP